MWIRYDGEARMMLWCMTGDIVMLPMFWNRSRSKKMQPRISKKTPNDAPQNHYVERALWSTSTIVRFFQHSNLENGPLR